MRTTSKLFYDTFTPTQRLRVIKFHPPKPLTRWEKLWLKLELPALYLLQFLGFFMMFLSIYMLLWVVSR